MKQGRVYSKIKLSTAIQMSIMFLMVCIMTTIWPLDFIKSANVTGSEGNRFPMAKQVIAGSSIIQSFTPKEEQLNAIFVFVCGDIEVLTEDSFAFTLYDKDMMKMQELEISLAKPDKDGYFRIELNETVVPGESYFYEITEQTTPIMLAFEEKETANIEENGNMLYGPDLQDGLTLASRYEYQARLDAKSIWIYDLVIFMIGLMILFLVELVFRLIKRNREIAFEPFVKVAANIGVAIGSVYSFVAIGPMHLFSDNLVDIIFYEIGVIAFTGILLYAINHRWKEKKKEPYLLDWVHKYLGNYVQIIALAGCIWCCCQYINGAVNFDHDLATRRLLIFFGIAVIAMFRKKELLNLTNLIYTVIAASGGGVLVFLNKADEQKYQIAWLNVFVMILWGMIIINGVVILAKRNFYRVCMWYTIGTVIMFALLLLFSNTRQWTIIVAVPFGLFYLRLLCKDTHVNLCRNMIYALGLSFIHMMTYSLIYRPFHYYRYTRYPMFFMTVTVTSLYLALILCGALAYYRKAYATSPHLRSIGTPLLFVGAASSYLVMTVSRVGIFSVVIMSILVLIYVTVINITIKKDKIQSALIDVCRRGSYVILALIICFPAVFTLTRIVPAVINRPSIPIEWERFENSITEGEPLDSPRYITVSRFFELLGARLPVMKLDSKEEPVKEEVLNIGQDSVSSNVEAADVPETPAKTEAQETFGIEEDYTNGRAYLFQAYWKQLNMTGHETMGFMMENGKMSAHAHNTYLQVAYDHGMIVGIVFLCYCVMVFGRAVWYYYKNRRCNGVSKEETILPLLIIGMFGISSMAEWTFHPCIPIGFAFLLIQGVLFRRNIPKKKRRKSVPVELSNKGMIKEQLQ